jgi:hypothetical protein
MALQIVKESSFSFQVFYNGNLYHDPRYPWSKTMRALVVNAGKLDEAALALSTEPVVSISQ